MKLGVPVAAGKAVRDGEGLRAADRVVRGQRADADEGVHVVLDRRRAVADAAAGHDIAVAGGPRDRAAAGDCQGGAGAAGHHAGRRRREGLGDLATGIGGERERPASVAVAPLLSVKVMITDVPAPTGL